MTSINKYNYLMLLNGNVVKNNFTCPVCFELILLNIYNCSNSHIICNICYSKINKCPICRVNLFYKNIVLEKIINTLISNSYFKCINNMYGCLYFTTNDLLNNHEKICEYKQIKCPIYDLKKCKWINSLNLLIHHIKETNCITYIHSLNNIFNIKLNLKYTQYANDLIYSKPILLINNIKVMLYICKLHNNWYFYFNSLNNNVNITINFIKRNNILYSFTNTSNSYKHNKFNDVYAKGNFIMLNQTQINLIKEDNILIDIIYN